MVSYPLGRSELSKYLNKTNIANIEAYKSTTRKKYWYFLNSRDTGIYKLMKDRGRCQKRVIDKEDIKSTHVLILDHFPLSSYAIDRNTDPDRQFAVDGTGLVTTAKLLDRETTPVHRIHILAIDKGNLELLMMIKHKVYL